MTTPITRATAVKKAVFELFKAEAVVGGLLVAPTGPGGDVAVAPVDVRYSWKGDLGPVAVYGGGWRFEQEDYSAEGPGLLVGEVIRFSINVRVQIRPAAPGGVQDTDAIANTVCVGLVQVLKAHPEPYPGYRVEGFPGGMGDYDNTDDETVSRYAFELRLNGRLSWGG
jgi:hypothetical protein